MRMRGLAVQMQELGLSIICYGNSRHQVVMYMMYNVINKGGLTTRFDPPPNGLRELKLHR